MKKVIGLLLAIVLLMGMFTVAAAEEEKPLVGIICPAATHGWVAGVTYYAQQKAEELGLNYKLYNPSDVDEMSSAVDELVSLGAKAIVLNPQFTGMETATQAAVDAGVIIVNFDMAIDVEGTYLLTGDNYDMGVQSANYIAEKLEGAGKVVVLDVPGSGNVAADRKAGFLDTIATIAPDIEIIGTYNTEFSAEVTQNDMADILTKHDQIDAVFSMDDESSIGALNAISEAGRTDIKAITGGGGCQTYFEMMPDNEIWISSALYSPMMMADCVENAYKLLNGETVETLIVEPTTIVDKDNVADFLDANSPY